MLVDSLYAYNYVCYPFFYNKKLQSLQNVNNYNYLLKVSSATVNY